MADYIFIRKSRNALSSALHIVLNLLLAIVSIGATIITGNCIIGLILVIISKWRIFAVNHRYWLLNIRSSLVDLIVGTSFVLLTYYTIDSSINTTFLPVHFLLMALYAIWLIIVKPRSSTTFTIIQALTAVLLGSTAAVFLDSTISTALHELTGSISDSGALTLIEFLIGFAASHHVLVQNAKNDYLFPSLICALIFGEISWLMHSWLILYTIDSLGSINTAGVCLSQLGIILSVLAFAYFKIYNELAHNKGKIQFANIALPVTFCLVVIIVLLTGFSLPRFNIY